MKALHRYLVLQQNQYICNSCGTFFTSDRIFRNARNTTILRILLLRMHATCFGRCIFPPSHTRRQVAPCHHIAACAECCGAHYHLPKVGLESLGRGSTNIRNICRICKMWAVAEINESCYCPYTKNRCHRKYCILRSRQWLQF